MILTKKLLHQYGACDTSIDFCERNKLFGFDLDRIDEIEGDHEYYIEWLKYNIINSEVLLDDRDNIIYLGRTDMNSSESSRMMFSYDKNNNKTTEYNMNTKYWTRWEYDSNGNMIKEEDVKGSWTKYKYNSRNELIKKYTSDGLRVRFKYDKNSNKIYEEGYCGTTVEYTYDNNNNMIFKIDSYDGWTKYEYDERNYVIRTTESCGFEETSIFDDHNNMIYRNNNTGRCPKDGITFKVEYYPDGQLKQYQDLVIPYFEKT
jgi:YD repeat-containing protein